MKKVAKRHKIFYYKNIKTGDIYKNSGGIRLCISVFLPDAPYQPEKEVTPMRIGKRKTVLMRAVSQLKEADLSKEPELNGIYRRLLKGRQQFAQIFEKNIKAVMQISSLDLMMQHQTEKIMDISLSVARATETLFGPSGSGNADSKHEELTNTIIQVSSETEEVYQKIEQGQDELTSIKELSAHTIEISEELRKDMNDLSEVINRMNEVIAGIDAISLQTNLLALNASIEAARAGAAGKGFAVVADEIRSLAVETQKLTGSMSEFVEGIKNASGKSLQSTTNTITALETVTDKIENVWELNLESQQHVSQVNDSMSSIAAVSEEISRSMTEMENHLRDSTSFMQQVSEELKKAAEPVVDIEQTLDLTVKQMGAMSEDAFFHLENAEFSQYVSTAITAHQTWLGNLEKMVRTRIITPLQLDSSKCGFGHFYYSMTPKIPEILPIWQAMGPKHQRFHKYGNEIISALNGRDYFRAEELYKEAHNFSKELISDLEKMVQIAGK